MLLVHVLVLTVFSLAVSNAREPVRN